ncbi:MAG: hypothetical protein JKY92_03350 [Magnetovibrio sp.]|nr:hypothetical protein [Magnetovibrio sp.]
MKNLMSMKKVYFVSICILLFVGLTAFTYRNKLGLTNRGPLFSDEFNRYIGFEFVPKYKIRECVIQFDLRMDKFNNEYIKGMNNAFYRYVSYNEPTVGAIYFDEMMDAVKHDQFDKGYTARYELLFPDQCDRKDEIFNSMVSYAKDLNGEDFSITQVSADHIKWDVYVKKGTPSQQEFRNYNGLWIDSPSYDPGYWPTFHKAMRGDGKALFKMISFQNEYNYSGKHLYMSLAEHFLPDGPLKDQARSGKANAFKQMSPGGQEQADKSIEYLKQQIKRYQSE